MLFPLLYIRLRQFLRELNHLGLYIIFVIAIIGFLIFYSYKIFLEDNNGVFIIAGLIVFCLYLQVYRKDSPFIYKHINRPQLQIFSEYIALTFPFSFTAVFTKSWYFYPALLICLAVISFIKISPKEKTIFKNLSLIIPASNFEWISGYRKQYFAFSFLYLFAVAFCWFKILPLFLLWALTILISSFYNKCEPVQILREGNKLPMRFLWSKIKKNSLYILILYTPLILINTIVNPDYLLINLLFVPTQISFLSFSICWKYGYYSPNATQTSGSLPLAVVGMVSSLPYLLPIPVLLSVAYFYKASHQLKPYLND